VSRWLVILSLLAAVVLPSLPATAHPLRPGVLVVEELEQGRVIAALRASIPVNGAEAPHTLTPHFSAPCTPWEEAAREGDLFRVELGDCPKGLAGTAIAMLGLEHAPDEEVLVRVHLADGRVVHQVLHARASTLTIPADPSAVDVVAAYVRIGALHFALGLDHVAFLVGLVLLVGAPRRVVVALSAFTAAHALTLGLASAGLLALPQAPVEATIALSIALLGVDLARRPSDPRTRLLATTSPPARSLTERAPATIAFAIGLVHGLGFAGALAETGVPREALALGLVSFHVGLELAQLGFVVATLGLLALAARYDGRWLLRLERASAYALGTAGVFWSIDRTISMFG
jgi:hypothetical protein